MGVFSRLMLAAIAATTTASQLDTASSQTPTKSFETAEAGAQQVLHEKPITFNPGEDRGDFPLVLAGDRDASPAHEDTSVPDDDVLEFVVRPWDNVPIGKPFRFEYRFQVALLPCSACRLPSLGGLGRVDSGPNNIMLNFTTDENVPSGITINGRLWEPARTLSSDDAHRVIFQNWAAAAARSGQTAQRATFQAWAVPADIPLQEAEKNPERWPEVTITDWSGYASYVGPDLGPFRESSTGEVYEEHRRYVELQLQIHEINGVPEMVSGLRLSVTEHNNLRTSLDRVVYVEYSPDPKASCDTVSYVEGQKVSGRLLEQLATLGAQTATTLPWFLARSSEADVCNPAEQLLEDYAELRDLLETLGQVDRHSRKPIGGSDRPTRFLALLTQ